MVFNRSAGGQPYPVRLNSRARGREAGPQYWMQPFAAGAALAGPSETRRPAHLLNLRTRVLRPWRVGPIASSPPAGGWETRDCSGGALSSGDSCGRLRRRELLANPTPGGWSGSARRQDRRGGAGVGGYSRPRCRARRWVLVCFGEPVG